MTETLQPSLPDGSQREAEAGTVALRLRHRRDEGVMALEAAVERIANVVRTRALEL